MTERRLPPLDFGTQNGNLGPMTLGELREWLSQEKDKWEWLKSIARSEPSAHPLRLHLHKQWGEIDRALTSASASSEADDKVIESVVRASEAVYSQNRVIRSGSPRGSFILELAQVDPAAASAAASFMIGLKVQSDSAKALEGALRAVQFDQGVVSNIEHERQALASLRAEWVARFVTQGEEVTTLLARAEALVEKVKEQGRQRGVEFQRFVEKAEGDKNAIEKTYKEHMALKAPVEYWREKAEEHGKRAGWLGAAVVIAFALGGFALFSVVQKFLVEPGGDPGSWKLAVVAVFTALGIWVIQILVRLLLSDLHQAADARERVTMARTFLSMMSEGKMDGEAGRSVVLQALFRGTQTGLVRDEVAPPTVIGMINKTLKG